MAYTYVFANVTSISTPNLDANYNAAGLLGSIPCTVTGTNAITMTPYTTPTIGTPPFSLQAQVRVSGIALNSNSGAMTANVGGTGALNVFKNSASGPVALTGGELVASNYFVLAYSQALQGGSGGWYLLDALVAGAPTGSAGGDLSGTYPNPTVAKINGIALGSTTATSGNILVAGGSSWVTKSMSGDATLASTGAITVTKTNGTNLSGLSTATYVAPASWTPADGSGAALSFSGVSANYTRLANMVFAYFTLTYPATGDTSAAIVSGLPVAVPNQTYAQGPAACWVSAGSIAVIAVPIINGSTFRFVNQATAANVTNANLTGLSVRACLVYPAS